MASTKPLVCLQRRSDPAPAACSEGPGWPERWHASGAGAGGAVHRYGRLMSPRCPVIPERGTAYTAQRLEAPAAHLLTIPAGSSPGQEASPSGSSPAASVGKRAAWLRAPSPSPRLCARSP